MKKVIITGATGFIGRHLTETLLKQGVEVYGIGRNKMVLEELSRNRLFHPIQADFEEYANLDQRIQDRGFDIFFHIAHLGVNGASKNDYRIQLNNTMIACDAVITAKRLGCKRFLFAGSVDEYEACLKPDAGFIQPTHSRIYGISKFAAENIGKTVALSNGIEFVGVLLSLTYGEGNRTTILPNTMIRNAKNGDPINLITGDNLFDMIYVDEAVGGMIAAADRGKNMESYYVGHHDLDTFKSIVLKMKKLLHSASELRFGTYPDPDYNIDYATIHRTKLYEHTGYICEADFEESLLKTKDWLLKVDQR